MPTQNASHLQPRGRRGTFKISSPSLVERKRKKPWGRISRKSQSRTLMTAWTAAAVIADAGTKAERSAASSP